MRHRALRSLLLCVLATSIAGCGTSAKINWYQAAIGPDSSAAKFENDSPFHAAVVWQYPDAQSCSGSSMQPMPFGGETSPFLPPDQFFETRIKNGQTFTFKLIAHKAVNNIFQVSAVCSDIYSFEPQRGYRYVLKMAAHDKICEVQAYKIDELNGRGNLIPEPSLRMRESRSSLISGGACVPETTTSK